MPACWHIRGQWRMPIIEILTKEFHSCSKSFAPLLTVHILDNLLSPSIFILLFTHYFAAPMNITLGWQCTTTAHQINKKVFQIWFFSIILVLPLLAQCTLSTGQSPTHPCTYSTIFLTAFWARSHKFKTPQIKSLRKSMYLFSLFLIIINRSGKHIKLFLLIV